jgi:hypothetical protein
MALSGTISEVTVTPFLIAIDVVNNAIDFPAFLDHLKSVQKKEVVIINAQDCNEGAHHKSGSKSRHSKQAPAEPSGSSIVRGLRTRVDGELAKALDAKKKALASTEKAARSKSSSRSKSRANAIPVVYFEGRVDVLFVIQNYPYLPSHVRSMRKAGLDVSFISIVPPGDLTPNRYPGRPKAPATPQKKAPLVGSELDFTQNLTAYPPARWQMLTPTVSGGVAFVELLAEESPDRMFRSIESTVVKLVRGKEAYKEFSARCQMKLIPTAGGPPDTRAYTQYVSDREDDFVNGLFDQLRHHKWGVGPVPPPPTRSDHFKAIFGEFSRAANRRVTHTGLRELRIPSFDFPVEPSLHPWVYPLLHWQVGQHNALDAQALAAFSDHRQILPPMRVRNLM